MKFSGEAGFREENVETSPGIYETRESVVKVRGDVLNYGGNHNESTNSTIDNFTTSNQLSIVASRYTKQNISNLLWVKWNGVKWKVSSFRLNSPRVIVTLGGVYNGPEEI